MIDEHAAATNRLHTGRPPSGTTIYPSIGSVVAHERGAVGDGVPPYVVFHDAALRSMAAGRPVNLAEMSQIPGVGAKKLEAYGEAFLRVISEN